MKRIPGATYRLQFNAAFTLQHASEILAYLSELGISDIYASPLLQAGSQSTHGYDTCSFEKLNPNLGSPRDFDRFTDDLKNRGMGLLLDVVPNHMSATLANPWWADILQGGRESVHAGFFDIDWSPPNPALQGKILLPVLEDHYGKVLESGKLQLVSRNGKYFIAYHDRNLPVNPASIPAGDHGAVLNELNGKPGNARSFDKLDALIQRQHYRLAYWRVASEEINYRRFFDVTEMAALKMESPEVFCEAHRLIFDWLAAGKVTGLRIDHPDGLWDPKQYLERLQAGFVNRQQDGIVPARAERPLYVVVEKILSGAEQLPGWPVEGTTGYDFLNRANGLFVDGFNALAIHEIYLNFTGRAESFADIVFDCRKHVLEQSFASELNALTQRLRKIALGTRVGRDLTFSELRAAIMRLAANFPVYRTYIAEKSTVVSEQDRAVIQKAVDGARKRSGSQADSALDFIVRILLLESFGELPSVSRDAREFVMKFQQLTGPAMAKGLEDTAFYQFNQLVSLNEVGGDPGKFGVTVEEFHEANALAAKKCPHTMLASATHDTKRGEDVRARLNVLSEIPVEWHNALGNWSRMNRDKKTVIDNAPAPDASDEYLLYQTLIGAWPADAAEPEGWKSFRERITAFMLKA
ncbi:MAG TPA: malto-oligosyltrehalose synthase, partial [Candidatus Polarisedimenticolia bacterium]|nr:malto-oligosyltrehalose synthase [Candidatus Polarisedimenticolia bacterium]